MDLTGKVALVTGAAQGIGRSFTEALLRHGAKVALLDLNRSAGEACKKALDRDFDAARSLFIACNVGAEEELKCIFPAAHGPVYTATKHGVVGFTRAIAATSKLLDYGVRINTICPAFVDTPLLNSVNHEEVMGRYYIFKDAVKKLVQQYGILEPSLIVQGLMKILQEEELNGAVMKITKSKGIHFEIYETMLMQPEVK
ncbi:15-hydroxyprostaglandin dehydrogenase [NAD(+)]-like isoform X2 [Stegostoma tigrinum]|uniref:15-hydroxyprostaglandin dehydrogenase [NAD(+)]-like isoform X2 n=1 Tax=Stegostoma tigrinum TaxID=3053191 RepID=UPI00286FB847|nr:15-hydroxyprostaglandin dehydrogenase [NAD(+)]-like isoform X2 [Stegostoma tigrinum]